METKEAFPLLPLSASWIEQLSLEEEDSRRISFREDAESITIYIDGIYAGYVEKGTASTPWFLETLVEGSDYRVKGALEAFGQTFEDFESMSTNQRIRASILQENNAVELNELLLRWMKVGLSQDKTLFPLIERDEENPLDLLRDLLREWGKVYYSRR